MLATLLADTTIEGVAGNTVTLAAAGHREGLEHKRDAIGKLQVDVAEGENVSGAGRVAAYASWNGASRRKCRCGSCGTNC